jgi:methylated-DNA-[protein]-cysteine S-methyltransferase
MAVDYLLTAIGALKIVANNSGLLSVKFVEATTDDVDANVHTAAGIIQLDEYFKGDRREFDLCFANTGTNFQLAVWQQLIAVSYGETLRYQDIANNCGHPKASQAVGTACANNPILVIVPCHRIIGSNGSLTGYAGGIDRKLWLLQHEGVI